MGNNLEDNDFYLDSIEIDPEDSIDESVLDMTDLDNLNNDIYSDLDYFDMGEVNTSVSFRSKCDEEVAQEVEETLISLLESDRGTISSLTGEVPVSSELPDDVISGFKQDYSRAISFNPAIKWYAKLSRLMPKEKFGVREGELFLAMTPKMFKKAIFPFMGDFDINNRESSLITGLVYDIAEKIKDKDVKCQLDMLKSESENEIPEDDLNVSEVDFPESLLDISNVHSESDLEVDEYDEMSGTSVDFDNNTIINPSMEDKLSISLRDLSLKAIADWVMDHKLETSEIEAKLGDEGFTRSQINNVIGIVKYKNVDNKIKGNFGGDVDFNFKM